MSEEAVILESKAKPFDIGDPEKKNKNSSFWLVQNRIIIYKILDDVRMTIQGIYCHL